MIHNIKKQRIFCGSLLLIIGYLPSVLNVVCGGQLPSVSNATNVNEYLFSHKHQCNTKNMLFSYEPAGDKNNVYLPTYRFDDSGFLLAFNKNHSNNLSVVENKTKFHAISNGLLSGTILVKSSIQTNFYVDAMKLKIPVSVVDTVIHNLSNKIDFNRSLKSGDRFEIVYNKKHEALYAKIISGKRSAAFYKFSYGNKSTYYTNNGVKLCAANKNESFGRPLKCSYRISSNYGMRVHPITKIWHYHTGADLCVHYGSPVYAMQNGVITRASRYSGYGNCVDILHNAGYSSRYAHLSRCAIRYGMYVKKGQLIGYVGSSGSSTGPHLHLELLKNNRAINPFSIKMLPQDVVSLAAREFFIYKKVFDTIVNKY